MSSRSSAAPDEIPEPDRFETTPHPRLILDFFGHPEAERELLQLYRLGRLPQALLIGGPEGVGKATLAWRLARFLLAYPDAAKSPPETSGLFVPKDHPTSREIAALAHPDVFLLRRAWNEKTRKLFSEIRADDVRGAVRLFQQAAGRGGYRICIVDSVGDLNHFGANALLKMIEEPPPRSLFLIIAHRPGQVLATLRSRCRKIILSPLAPADIAQISASLGPPWSQADSARAAAEAAPGLVSLHGVLRRLGGQGGAFDAQALRLLRSLPDVDWPQVHALAERVSRPDAISDFEALLGAVFDWLQGQVRSAPAAVRARRLAPFAEVWERVSETARETETFNLDKRPLVLSIFADLAAACRVSASR